MNSRKELLVQALGMVENVMAEAKRTAIWSVYRKALNEKKDIEAELASINREEKAKREAILRKEKEERLERSLREARALRQKEKELLGKPTGIPINNRRKKPPVGKKVLANGQQQKAAGTYRPFEGLKGLTI